MLSIHIMQRIILIIIGWIAVVLGTLGVVLPLLPTTPFILLAAWCFARSSPRFHDWLLYRSWFGGYLRHWQKHRAMPPGAKPRAILLILVTFSISLVAGQYDVGPRPATGYSRLFTDFYVADPGD
ncbi:Inner membrane protein ybaN [Citrobacter freundii]|nr:Inner membrane protein ybaN [Citrobacter freundii]